MNPSDKYQIIMAVMMVGALTADDPHKRSLLWILAMISWVLAVFLNIKDKDIWKN